MAGAAPIKLGGHALDAVVFHRLVQSQVMPPKLPSPWRFRRWGAIERDPVFLRQPTPQPGQPGITQKGFGGHDFANPAITLFTQRGSQEIKKQLALAVRQLTDGYPGTRNIPDGKVGPACALLSVEVVNELRLSFPRQSWRERLRQLSMRLERLPRQRANGIPGSGSVWRAREWALRVRYKPAAG